MIDQSNFSCGETVFVQPESADSPRNRPFLGRIVKKARKSLKAEQSELFEVRKLHLGEMSSADRVFAVAAKLSNRGGKTVANATTLVAVEQISKVAAAKKEIKKSWARVER